MRAVFADTLYWVGLLDQKDPWHKHVMRANRAIGRARVVTTDAVIVEVMNALSGSGPAMRDRVSRFAEHLLTAPGFEVVAQDRARLLDAVAFYRQRLDKGYSLTD